MSNILTGIKPTGMPHLGNYLSVIKPSIERMEGWGLDYNEYFFFIADYHALTTVKSRKELKENTYKVAATWLACGLNSHSVNFYLQSDIPEIFQLAWMLSCYTPKGLLNRSHAYKSAVDKNTELEKDPDSGIDSGLYNYPILMAADILLFKASKIPVGSDQLQHIEMARDIAQRFNHRHKKALTIPEADIVKDSEVILGLDGRKMSKSYDNTIPLCCTERQLRKIIMSIPTDSEERNAPKNPDTSLINHYHKYFSNAEDHANFEKALREGLSWGDAKEELFKKMNGILTPIRESYDHFMSNTDKLDKVLARGGKQVREVAKKNMEEILERM